MNRSIRWIARTAILLALTVMFQSLRLWIPAIPSNISQTVVGSLVNLCLIVAAVMMGIRGGLIIALAAPIIALIQGFTPSPVLVVPIAFGNFVLVVMASLLYDKNPILAVVTGAVLKFITLYLGVVKIVLPFFLPNAPDKMRAALSAQFSWPQLVTAGIGGVLAVGILTVLRKSVREE
ncbi:ECF transporter S component [Eubacteriales bacterium mix99]|jgi:hypothetical protein|nr:hypothetical protein [Clostridiales bacterium]